MKFCTFQKSVTLFTARINCILICLLLGTIVSVSSFSQTGPGIPGVAPMVPPTGNMDINGFLQRQGAAGDWLAAPGGSPAGTYIFPDAPTGGFGVFPGLVPLSFHLVDRYNDQTLDEIFDGGNKLFHDPNTWGWRSQKPPAKDDINNAMVLIAQNPADGHIWVAISGDRLSTNGTSYLDFEFYQNPITRTGGPIPGGTGGFLSTGPNGGRTIGDLSITLDYTGGGNVASVSFLQWTNTGESTFDYLPITPATGTVFVSANIVPINVPYGAFGSTTYDPLQFVEAAIDLTALIGGATFPSECSGLPFSTLFIKSKSSAERTADLKDFIDPLQISVCFDETPPVFTSCPQGSDLGCNPSGLPAPNGAVATDNCSIADIISFLGPISSDGCTRTQTRTYLASDDCGNTATCGQTFTWTEDNTAPVITAGGTTLTLGCSPSSADINAALGTATASDNCGAVTPTASTGSVGSTGCMRSQTRTWNATDACGNTATPVSRTVTWTQDNTPPVFTSTPASVDIACFEDIPEIVNPTASDACGSVTVTMTGSTDDPADCVTGFNRIVTRSWVATDGCGNTATYTQTIRVECCEAICTYTQGYYGNPNGTSCDGTTGGHTTAQLIGLSLGNWGGTLTVGKPGNSVIMNNNAGDIDCIIAKLPGGGPAKELPAGNFGICNLPNSIATGNGRIRNVLLAQTITLGLNIGITNPSDLGIFPLQVGVLATADPVDGCGDDTPKERICVYNPDPPFNLVNVINEYTYRTFTAEVINAIPGTKNVAGLFELANRALANMDGVVGSENGASLSAIANAAGAINEVFDECKIFVGWDVEPCPSTDPNARPGASVITENNDLSVRAFPNPYEENFTLRIKSPVSGNATIEFFTMDGGHKISEVNRSVLADREAFVLFKIPPSVYRSRIVYIVTIGKYTERGIVLSPN